MNSTAAASSDSYQKILEGSVQLQRGNDQAAFELFEAATRADPQDAQAWLFTGTALNQLGNSTAALTALDRSRELGSRDPELLFQTARSLIGTGRHPAAIQTLLEFEAQRPGRGQTSEYLGRAYFATGELAKAGTAFRQAIERDPSLRSTVLPYQAELARQQNDQLSTRQRLADLYRFAPDSATAHVLREELGSRDRTRPEYDIAHSPFKFTVSESGGYNTNIRGIEQVAVEGNTRGKPSFFDETRLGGSYGWTHLTPTSSALQPDQLTLAGSLVADNYPQATAGDFFASSAFLEYSRPLFESLTASLQLSADFDALSWQGFRDRLAGRAAVQWRFNDRLAFEGAYNLADDDYLYHAAPVQDPDAISNTFSLDGYLSLSKVGTKPDRVIAARIGGYFALNRADGSDFDYNGGGFIAGLDFPLIEKVRANVLYTWSWTHYLNLNSLIFDPMDILQQPTGRRNDSCDSISLHLTRRMEEFNPHLTFFADFDFTRNSSNIPVYRFSQQVFSVGLSWSI